MPPCFHWWEIKKVADCIFEDNVNNIPADGFSAEEVKRLHDLRWGIEASFRDL